MGRVEGVRATFPIVVLSVSSTFAVVIAASAWALRHRLPNGLAIPLATACAVLPITCLLQLYTAAHGAG